MRFCVAHEWFVLQKNRGKKNKATSPEPDEAAPDSGAAPAAKRTKKETEIESDYQAQMRKLNQSILKEEGGQRSRFK